MAWDPITSTLIFGENDAVLVDTLTAVAEVEALAFWIALRHRELTTIYITHGHLDHFAGLRVLLQRVRRRPRHRHTEIGEATNCALSRYIPTGSATRHG
jgi:glyoxylase-like metal-dependent hydrolase (beta-lactamase superfamily II)